MIENMLDFGMDDSRDAVLEPVPIPPATVKVVETDDTHGLFIIEPLPRGFGMTLGLSLIHI